MSSALQFGTHVNRFSTFDPDFRPLVKFVQTAEELGYHHVRNLDHVVGIVAERHGGIAQTPYTDKSVIREVFTLFAYLSAVTTRIKFMTGVLVLPQRQTVLVAKQAAEVDILSGGRLLIGCAVGYNPIEYKALGFDFKDRGKRFEEQVHVLRMLWNQREVSFEGEYHSIEDVSLAPQPIQRPIPLFFGMGRAIKPIPPDVVLRRVGRLADGWLPIFGPDAEGQAAVNTVHAAAVEAGRNPNDLIMEMGLQTQGKSADQIRDGILRRQEFGAKRICLGLGGDSPEEQTDELKRVADVLHSGWLS